MTNQSAEEMLPVDSESGESEEDVIDRLTAARASISATDWTIETIVTQMRKGRIDLNPKFQRRAAWTNPTKSRFVESAILSYPIPQIVLAEKPDRPGHYFVIDGKQRLLALRQFYAGEGSDKDTGFEPFKITGTSILESVRGFDIKKLEDQRADLFDAFENHTIRTVSIKGWESEAFLYTLFLRLNTGSVPLSPQELRQALVPGDFVNFVDEQSGISPGLQHLLGNKGPDRRMIDAEMLVRYLGFRNSAVPYRGNLKDFLDKTCVHFNKYWASSAQSIIGQLSDMERAIDAARQIFSDEGACHKWSGVRWERSLNRAVFDVQIYALSDMRVRDVALGRSEEVRDAFKRLCVEDDKFVAAVTSTTKSIEATRNRFDIWNRELGSVLGIPVQRPACLAD
ncbi:DUF262 domain-containing protein [Streptomyces lunaelactis]|uniref:DUF262 domain-containing protein n=1 Tax=Streptomyces lunaelactis TaxID=1535768 RepID=UPI0015848C26|nr:DUF262 domain-containing protein [Streptomyces lunaelactis]NUK35068.1 DUF262 domain-containing protein [Streptomyces lunaelactis]NUK44659.1 DUF262 domain-containing protein [Streptomyces lunaelactis]NUK92125.1 DUF262 domain-containing protein [Streptomyces lunaelactis]NUL29898.1 DUF262 domain-containing protein [Streptomyces lunaelactis]